MNASIEISEEDLFLHFDGNWILRFVINLFCYASVLLPFAVLVYCVKRKNLLSHFSPNGWAFRFLESLAGKEEGLPMTTKPDSSPSQQTTDDGSDRSFFLRSAKLMLYFVGLQVAYLTWGVLQERIMTRDYTSPKHPGNVERFRNSQFLVLLNRISALCVALGVLSWFSIQTVHSAPLYKYGYSSLSNIISTWCQYEALKFVSFPTQVLSKTSKVVAVMLMGKVIRREVYQYHEYTTALVISAGVALFLITGGPADTKRLSDQTTISGVCLILLGGYIVSDSYTQSWQGALCRDYHINSFQMMAGVNFFSTLLTLVSLLEQGFGQIFIFATIKEYGAPAFAIIMTIRQMVAIFLSNRIFEHHLSMYSLVGVCVVFGGVFARVYISFKERRRGVVAELAQPSKV